MSKCECHCEEHCDAVWGEDAPCSCGRGQLDFLESLLRGDWGDTPMSRLLRRCADEPSEVHHRTFFLEVADALDRCYAVRTSAKEGE